MKLCVLVPAYNCAATIQEVCQRVTLPGPDDEIVVLDDHSRDDTFQLAKAMPRTVVHRNPANLGYGGTSKRLYELALERGAELTVNVHGDLGHRPEDIPALLEVFSQSDAEVVIGSRLLCLLSNAKRLGWRAMLTNMEARKGMPLIRFVGHVVLTAIQNRVYASHLHSFHEGMRACRRSVVNWIVNADFPVGYSYDNELVYQAHRHGIRIKEVPVPPSYDSRAKTASPPFKYGLSVLGHVARVVLTGK